MFDKFVDKLTERPLEIAAVIGLALGGCVLLVIAVLGFFSRMDHDDLALTAAVMALLLPIVTIASYETGKLVTWQQITPEIEAAENSAYHAARLSERLKAQREIDRLEASHAERGDAFLQGAQKGLNLAEKVTTARVTAQREVKAVVVSQDGRGGYVPKAAWRIRQDTLLDDDNGDIVDL